MIHDGKQLSSLWAPFQSDFFDSNGLRQDAEAEKLDESHGADGSKALVAACYSTCLLYVYMLTVLVYDKSKIS